MSMIFVVMQSLYFGNIIPPIPLSLREAGVYHNIERTGIGYILLAEKETLLERFIPGQVIHVIPNKPVYIYSAIFAPTKLQTRIVHHWQKYDEKLKQWIDKDRLSFTLLGGRDKGYRGYSVKSSIYLGKWRVKIETERGQVLGSIRFDAVEAENELEIEKIVK